MIEKTSCQHCGIHIEFDVENASQFVPCPSCGKQTRLLMPAARPSTFPKPISIQQATPEFLKPLRKCGDCEHEISKRAVFCPSCGGFNTIPFGLVWQGVCFVIACYALLEVLMALFQEAAKAIGSSL